MTTPNYDLPAAVANVPLAQERFARTLFGITDADLREPSVLPGWSRAHVIAHVARQAEAMLRLIDGVLTQRVTEAAAGDAAAHAADIETSAKRSLDDLIDDVAETNASLVIAFARMTAPTWARPVQFAAGTFPASRCAWARWREIEVHHVDLGLDVYPIDSWPEEFVASHLPHELAKLPSRLAPDTAIRIGDSRFGSGEEIGVVDGPDDAVLAWLFGRVGLAAPALTTRSGPLPKLPAWG